MAELLTTYDYPVKQNLQVDIITANYVQDFIKPLTFGFFGQSQLQVFDADKYQGDFTGYYDKAELVNGKSVFATVTLESEAYQQEFYNPQTKQYDKATIPAEKIDLGTVLVDIEMNKNIVTTQINGRSGTVKEYIADGDYQITLRGALVNPTGTNYPYADFTKLNAVVKAPVSLKVTSEFLSLFPVHNLVIVEYTFPQQEGLTNTQLFQLNCLSDSPIELSRIF